MVSGTGAFAVDLLGPVVARWASVDLVCSDTSCRYSIGSGCSVLCTSVVSECSCGVEVGDYLVCVSREHPHESQDLKFRSKAVHFKKQD